MTPERLEAIRIEHGRGSPQHRAAALQLIDSKPSVLRLGITEAGLRKAGGLV